MVLALFFLWASYFKQRWRGGGWQNSKQWKLYFPRYLKFIEWSQLTFVFGYFLDQVMPLRTNTMGGTPKGPIAKELVASVQFFCLSLYITASPLHKNLQVVNYERCKYSSGYSKETQTCASTSGVCETAPCPPPRIADDPSAPGSPTSSPSFGQ